MKKLDDQINWYARVYVKIKIKQNLGKCFEEMGSFPIDIGAISLKSKDGKRDYVLDPYYTEYCDDKEKVGEIYTFYCKLEVDKGTFPEEEGEYNYGLTVEDLEDCTGEFYCHVDSDYMEEPDIDCVFFMDGGFEHTHVVKCKQE
jgi:hypothetical protein